MPRTRVPSAVAPDYAMVLEAMRLAGKAVDAMARVIEQGREPEARSTVAADVTMHQQAPVMPTAAGLTETESMAVLNGLAELAIEEMVQKDKRGPTER